MNDNDKEKEDENVIIPSLMKVQQEQQQQDLSNYYPQYLPTASIQLKPNLCFERGEAAEALDSIIQDTDLQAARARIQKRRQDISEQQKTIDEVKLSAGNIWKYASTNRLGDDVLE